jgi:hypothetical protein
MRIRILLALIICLPLCAQSWDTLHVLRPGDKVKVLETSGQEHSGAMTAVSAEAISLQTGARAISIERARVRRVQVRSAARRARRIAIAAAAGLALGLVIDQTLGTFFRNETGETTGDRALTYLAPTALFGGLAAIAPGYRTVYRLR